MKNYQLIRTILLKIFLVFLICLKGNILLSFPPDTPTDEIFKKARQVANNEKDYGKAIQLTLEALKNDPENADMRVFLGQLYTWDKNRYEQARESFYFVLRRYPGHEGAALGIAELEMQNGNYTDALFYCGKGLSFHPDSEKLLVKKVEILTALGKYRESRAALSDLLTKFPDSEQGLLLKQTGVRKKVNLMIGK